MKKTAASPFLPLSSISLLVITLLISSISGVRVNPLPKPREITWGDDGPVKLAKSFKLNAPDNAIIREAWGRAIDLISNERWEPRTIEAEPPNWPSFPPSIGPKKRSLHERRKMTTRACATLNSIDIRVNDLKADLQHGVDESYALKVNSNGTLSINSETIWGTLHAFQTLTQIVILDENSNDLIIERTVCIKDRPIYPHRGLLLDTARNFYPVKDILRTIDALQWSKMNVLHWHVVDSQSWPLQLKTYKEMTKDAYSKREIYRPKDVQKIIMYARKRGVRVIPELDMPGHARAGYRQIDPSIVACGDSWWSNDNFAQHSSLEPPPGQLDIMNNKTYEVIENIYKEVAAAFPDNLYHAGFDELQKYCYAYSNYTTEWFKANPDKTWSDLAQIFLDRTYPMFTSKENGGKRVIMWEDVVLSSDFSAKQVPKNVILQTWNNGVNNTRQAVGKGYDVIVSSSDWFYLDCGFGEWVGNDPDYNQNIDNGNITFNFAGGSGGSWCGPYKSWQRIYDYDIDFTIPDDQKKQILGGEVALWSEQSDAISLDNKVWPRAGAFAELMWSGNKDEKGQKRYREMTQRMNEYRERLVARGVAAVPLQPKFCYRNPHACDLNRDPAVISYG